MPRIDISNAEGTLVWGKELSGEEYEEVREYVNTGRNSVSLISALWKPVRTNNLKNFAKDFVLPTMINRALRVENIACKIFAILAALVLDVCTLPIRCVTFIPRIIVNKKQGENGLRQYLIDENVDDQLLISDHVRVKLEWEDRKLISKKLEKGARIRKTFRKEKHWREINVNFIELPWHEDSNYSEKGKISKVK